MNLQRNAALQDHVVGVEDPHPEPSVVARNPRIDRLSQDAGPLFVGVHGVREEVRMEIQRRVEVDEFDVGGPGDDLDRRLDLVPLPGSGQNRRCSCVSGVIRAMSTRTRGFAARSESISVR